MWQEHGTEILTCHCQSYGACRCAAVSQWFFFFGSIWVTSSNWFFVSESFRKRPFDSFYFNNAWFCSRRQTILLSRLSNFQKQNKQNKQKNKYQQQTWLQKVKKLVSGTATGTHLRLITCAGPTFYQPRVPSTAQILSWTPATAMVSIHFWFPFWICLCLVLGGFDCPVIARE